MTRRARPPSPLPSFVKIAALLSASAVAGNVAAQDVDAQRPTIIVRLGGGAVPGATLTVDDKPAPFEGSLPVDPGVHTLVVTTPDGRTQRESIIVREGDRERAVVLGIPPPPPPEMLGGPPPHVERGGCCGTTRSATAARDVRGASAFLVLAAVLAARRKKKDEED